MFRLILLLTSLWVLFYCSILEAFAQGQNCSNPLLVNPCPTVTYTSVSTAGMANDISATVYNTAMNGNDIVYKVTPVSGNSNVLISIKNLSANAYLIISNNSCTVPYYVSQVLYSGISYDNLSYYATSSYPLYVMIDHNNATDITFDISFGSLGNYQTVTVPDTRGNWQEAFSCVSPLTKPSLNVKWNGVNMALPITLSPLNTQGTMCLTPYLRNLTGKQGVKKVVFTFDPDLSNPNAVVTQMNGFYNAGTWNAVRTGSVITWTFTDAAGLGRGDFTGSPNNCLAYDFCFTFTPLSNNPTRTNVAIMLYGDGYGKGYSYATYGSGCCASNTANCMLNYVGASGSGGEGAIGMGINDPPLPVELIRFNARKENNVVLLEWETASEINNDHFELERSTDGIHYTSLSTIQAAGRPTTYSFTDNGITTEERYYRLKQVDVDGQFSYSESVNVRTSYQQVVQLYPLPSDRTVNLSSTVPVSGYIISDLYGNELVTQEVDRQLAFEIPIDNLPAGIYMVSIKVENGVYLRQLIKQ